MAIPTGSPGNQQQYIQELIARMVGRRGNTAPAAPATPRPLGWRVDPGILAAKRQAAGYPSQPTTAPWRAGLGASQGVPQHTTMKLRPPRAPQATGY